MSQAKKRGPQPQFIFHRLWIPKYLLKSYIFILSVDRGSHNLQGAYAEAAERGGGGGHWGHVPPPPLFSPEYEVPYQHWGTC